MLFRSSSTSPAGIFRAVYACIQRIREAGVTGQMVARDFTKRRIAPLQWHSEPVWTYTGRGDAMRLSSDGFKAAREALPVEATYLVEPILPGPEEPTPRRTGMCFLYRVEPRRTLELAGLHRTPVNRLAIADLGIALWARR